MPLSDIINSLRRASLDQGAINKLAQELREIQPEVKGDAKQERIVKVTEEHEYDTDGSGLLDKSNHFIVLENDDKILNESDIGLILELGNFDNFMLLENSLTDSILLETTDKILL